MPNMIKLNVFIIINKVLKWFGGHDVSVFPQGIGFNPRWMHALMYIVQMQLTNIYIIMNTPICTFTTTKCVLVHSRFH